MIMDYNSPSSSNPYVFLSDEWISGANFDTVGIVGIIFFVLVILFGTTGNMLVVLAFCRNPSLRSHSINIYMVQTSVVNLIVSAVINPVYIITMFLNFKHITAIAVDYATLALMHLANLLSMYSLCAVATNRYLLIARPKTTFQIWCVPRRRIGCVLVGLWLATILTSFPYWAFLYYDLYVVIASEDAFIKLTIAGYILNSIWFLPIIIVPIMHIATLRVIKSSRMRIEGHSSDTVTSNQRNDLLMNVGPVPHTSSGLREPIGFVVGTESAEIRDVETGNDGMSAMEAATVNEADETNGEPGTTAMCCSRFCWTTQVALNVQPRRNRGLAESEMRLLKMMFLMYTILIISLVPAILSFTPIIHKGNVIVLGLFGFLIPIYPATMPYIFLWSNKNFRSAAAKLIQHIRMYVVRG